MIAPMSGAWLRGTVLTMVGALAMTGCTAAVAEPPVPPGAESPASPSPQLPAAAASGPSAPVTVLGGDAVELALAASALLWDTSPTVVVAAADDELAIEKGTALARTLVAPLLLGPAAPSAAGAVTPTASPTATPTASPAPVDTSTADELAGELARLGADTVVLAGDLPVVLPDGVEVLGPDETPDPQSVEPVAVVAVVAGDAPATAARATLEAVGAQVVTLTGADPREDPAAIRALASSAGDPVVGLGDSLGPVDRLAPLVAVAATGVELPGGGQTLFPGRRLVALYGHPQTSALGVLGEQGPVESVERARQVAASYQPFSDEPVLPAFELIATVASGGAGADGNYSNETPVQVLRPYVDAAAEAGVYVVLDLQPGRTDFVTQAQAYEELLVLPHVGLALDPEWRLAPDQVHLRQIGTVDASEITAVADWLAALVRDRALPQKLLLLHQFQQRMITNRQTLDAQRDELALLVQMDGDGSPGEKLATWQALLADAPPGLLFGWKNFYDEDTPTLSPEQTLAVAPTPWWVSYQ
jgi:hypothetical protein